MQGFPILIPTETYNIMSEYLGVEWVLDDKRIITEALLAWIKAQKAAAATAPSSASPAADAKPSIAAPARAAAGYQWKHLFLPAGTLLRVTLHGKNSYAEVVGDQIIHEGKTVSPSRFVAAPGGARRSAWRAVWLLLPGGASWRAAAEFR